MTLEIYVVMKLRDYMERLHLSVKDVEEATGFCHASIYAYLRGTRNVPLAFIDVFCKSYDISISSFYEGYDLCKNTVL